MLNFVIRTCVPWVNLSQTPGHHTQPTCDQKPGAMAWPAANAIATDVRPHGVELQREHALAPDRVRACQSWHLRRASSTHAPGSAQTHHDDQSLPRERESERESARGGEGERDRNKRGRGRERERGRGKREKEGAAPVASITALMVAPLGPMMIPILRASMLRQPPRQPLSASGSHGDEQIHSRHAAIGLCVRVHVPGLHPHGHLERHIQNNPATADALPNEAGSPQQSRKKLNRTAAAFRSAGVFFFLTFVVVSHPSSTCSSVHGKLSAPRKGGMPDARHCNTDNSAHLSLRQASATSATFLAVLLLLCLLRMDVSRCALSNRSPRSPCSSAG
jgi:hypothetical protein